MLEKIKRIIDEHNGFIAFDDKNEYSAVVSDPFTGEDQDIDTLYCEDGKYYLEYFDTHYGDVEIDELNNQSLENILANFN